MTISLLLIMYKLKKINKLRVFLFACILDYSYISNRKLRKECNLLEMSVG